MSDGYAQQDYVSKELSRLNDTLTREISQVKFSMAQMDDCCLRQDVSETEPVQILPNYLSEEKIMSMNNQLTDLYQRIQSRKGFDEQKIIMKKKILKFWACNKFKKDLTMQQRRVGRTHTWKKTFRSSRTSSMRTSKAYSENERC